MPRKGQEPSPAAQAALDANRHLGPPAARAAAEARREAEGGALDRAVEALDAEVKARGEGAFTPLVSQLNREVAHLRSLRERLADSWLRRYPTGAAVQATKRVATSLQCTKQTVELLETRERAIRLGLEEAARPNAGRPVRPRSDAQQGLAVAQILARQHALPGISPEAADLAAKLADTLERDQRDAKARAAELDAIPTTSRRQS